MTADDTNLYFTTASTIEVAPLSGGAAMTLVTGLSQLGELAVNATHVSWISNETTIATAPIGGGVSTPLNAMQTSAFGIVMDEGRVFWTNPIDYTGSVLSIPIGGGAITPIQEETFSPYAITSDGTSLFGTTKNSFGKGKLFRWPLAGGSEPEELASDLYEAEQIAVDATHVYITSN